MIGGVEAVVQRRLTSAFIQADYLSIVLLRAARADDGAGGVLTGDPAPLPAQTMRLIPQQDVNGVARETSDGQQIVPSYALLGKHTADVQRWDGFTHAGHRYEVLFVKVNQYEVKAEVAYLG